MQFPLPDGGNGAGAPARGTEDTAGALGKGLQFSNAMTLLFKFLAYIVPIFGGMLSFAELGSSCGSLLDPQVGWPTRRLVDSRPSYSEYSFAAFHMLS